MIQLRNAVIIEFAQFTEIAVKSATP